jgi:hypothetical protein
LSIGLWWFCGDGGCLEEIGDKYANQQACERDLLMRGTITENTIVRVWYTAATISGYPTDRIRNVFLLCWLPEVAFGASTFLPNQEAR